MKNKYYKYAESPRSLWEEEGRSKEKRTVSTKEGISFSFSCYQRIDNAYIFLANGVRRHALANISSCSSRLFYERPKTKITE